MRLTRSTAAAALFAPAALLVACPKPPTPGPGPGNRVEPLTHGRFQNLTWHAHGSGNEVSFEFRGAFRRTFYGGSCVNPVTISPVACTGPGGQAGVGDSIFLPSINFGDGESTGLLAGKVVAIDTINDFLNVLALNPGSATETKIEHEYDTAGPYTASFSDCCRISNSVNAGDQIYRISTLVDLRGGNTGSPSSTIQPVVDCADGTTCTFDIPAADPDGNTLRFRFATPGESGIPFEPSGASVDATTGVYTFDATGASVDVGQFYSTQVVIEEVDGAAVVTRASVDFLVRIVSATNGSPPAFDTPPSPVNGSTLNATVGTLLTFTLQASDPNAGNTVTINNLGLPTGVSFTCGAPANPTSCAFGWTPGAGDVGTYVLGFTATDNTGRTAAPYSLTIVVSQPGGKGKLKVRKIYDWMPAGFPAPNVGPYDPAGQLNGAYNYPEPIFSGWPMTVTPVDAGGNPTGPAQLVYTQQELQPSDGLYLDLDAGRYKVEELLPTSTTGGGLWSVTGANATEAGLTTTYGATTSIFVNVASGQTTVARFLNVCKLQGSVVRFPTDAGGDIGSLSWDCKPTFGTASN